MASEEQTQENNPLGNSIN